MASFYKSGGFTREVGTGEFPYAARSSRLLAALYSPPWLAFLAAIAVPTIPFFVVCSRGLLPPRDPSFSRLIHTALVDTGSMHSVFGALVGLSAANAIFFGKLGRLPALISNADSSDDSEESAIRSRLREIAQAATSLGNQSRAHAGALAAVVIATHAVFTAVAHLGMIRPLDQATSLLSFVGVGLAVGICHLSASLRLFAWRMFQDPALRPRWIPKSIASRSNACRIWDLSSVAVQHRASNASCDS